ncbi:hypothetical protein BCR33DRAFT_760871 [Rhizoclosmatium globosum]|uniref:Uncharacterized protein n=1 Tax=Rhizoclosmatium globosum TaxID=329046 RepID=A0A1Y2D2S2_9FUNG|nr:hypothetical protein BCR33DRAFT_760871 [Rhizoclosmatium globosum]|eukprot:ORY53414.1 hypothetical protein BCR33DRAFT_760871 [Rhizoclosmatium globosum]
MLDGGLRGLSLNEAAADKFDTLVSDQRNPASFCPFGVRLSLLETLIEDWGGRSMLESLTTQYVCTQFIAPTTAKSKLPFIAKLLQSTDPIKQGSVYDAAWFISHSTSSLFLNTVDALYAFFDGKGLDRESVVVWMNIFSSSLHMEEGERDFEGYSKNCIAAIKRMENVVLVMPEWEELRILQRAWVVYELFIVTETNSSFHIAMTPETSLALSELVQTSPTSIYNTLSGLATESSSCLLPKDLAAIITQIELTSGFPELNRRLCVLISHWLLAHLNNLLKSAETPIDRALLQFALGTLHDQMGNMQLALPFLLDSYETYLSTKIHKTDPRVSQIIEIVDPTSSLEDCFALAAAALQSGDTTTAESLFLKTIQFGDKVGYEPSPDSPDCLLESAQYLKDLYKSQNRTDLSKQFDNRLHLAALYKRHGLVRGSEDYELQRAELAAKHYVKTGELSDAIANYLILLRVQKEQLGEYDSAVITTLSQIADLHTKVGQPNTAVKYKVEFYYRTGVAHLEQNEMDKAERMFLRAFDFDATCEIEPGEVDYVIESVKRLVTLYQEQGRERMVKKYEALLQAALGN